MGSDYPDWVTSLDVLVSIHAPTWGATHDRTAVTVQGSFNPRSHMGSDLRQPFSLLGLCRFNPRSHMGSDDQQGLSAEVERMFQSTLPHGERQ